MNLLAASPHLSCGTVEEPLHNSLFSDYFWAAELHRQCRVTEESACCMQHSLLPLGVLLKTYHCIVGSLMSPGMKTCSSNTISHFGVSRVSVCIFTCQRVFLPVLLNLFMNGKPQADWIGDTPSFMLHHLVSTLFLSLPLVPLCNGTKALLGMA